MRKLKSKQGFTLIEVVVVMAIIAVLAVLVIGAITVARNTQKETVHRSNARTVQTQLEAWYAKNRSYPATSGTVDLNAAMTSMGQSTFSNASECTGTGGKPGGGTVAYSTTGYTITPYDSGCTNPLGSSDVLSNQ